jgi:CheY-like chemotaxis protein/anti-sigma regulatory factor (Ser/Thr protein kinase)
MIRRNVELEVRLIDDLLDLTRISRGKLALQMVPVNLREICRHAQQICDSDLRAKELKLYVAWNAANCTVQADAARLQQILWNLLKNAVKFTPAGGTITIRAENPTPDRIALTVTDTGIGITADQMPQLFKAFEQGDQSHQFGGLGLGLAISRQIAELHGGTLVAHSEGQNKGATFTFELATIAQMEQTTVPSPVRDNPSPPKTSRVLLVEDNPDTSRVMSRLLKLWGFEHHTADSVASALQCAQAESFDVVLSDIGLPDGSGWDLIRALRTRRSYKSIAISGYGMEDDLRRSTEAGFDIHLTKPVDLEHLRQTLHELSAK